MSDDFATRTDLDGLGRRLNRAEVDIGKHDVRVEKLESWTQDQEVKLDSLEKENTKQDLKAVTMKEEIVKAVTGRVGLYGILVVFAVAAIEFLGKVWK